MQSSLYSSNDYEFLLRDVLDFHGTMGAIGNDLDAELALSVLEEAKRFCSTKLQPLNRSGDAEGSHLIAGEVRTPKGFVEAYRAFVAAGWPALSGDPRYGGQGLPFILQLWLDEMISSANMSFGLFPGLTRGAVETIAAHADQWLKDLYLPFLVSGEWTGAMALTESGAGSDLGLLRTTASPRKDGSYALSGAKIFISSGDHDLADNIIHLVLARLPDAPEGAKGISLFLVPKILPDAQGDFTVRNSLSVGSLEEKMGIHAQPTCLMNYDKATGWLVGEPHRGLAAMFVMMNAERLFVGVQGLGVAGAAYGLAVNYASERQQGRSADGSRSPVPIIEHADVRRMLLKIRTFVEGGRALAGWVALQLDRAHSHPDSDERVKSDGFVALLTPVIKAAFTDMAFESTVEAQQVFGGHGYIQEWGIEQLVRDVRITQIYEGTNGIQAMDLVARKLRLENGKVVASFFELIERDICKAQSSSSSSAAAEQTQRALQMLRSATAVLSEADMDTLGALACDYLRLFALVSLGWMWTRMADADGSARGSSKRTLADFFTQKVLTQAVGLARSIENGGSSVICAMPEMF